MNDHAIPAGPARDALQAVLEAIDIPDAGTVGDQEIRDKILLERAGHAKVMLRGILSADHGPAWSAAYLREELAKHPAEGYQTWDARMAELGIR